MIRTLQTLAYAALLIPYYALAQNREQNTTTGPSFKRFVESTVVPLGDAVIYLLYLVAFLAFLVGVLRYFLAGANEESRQKGKQFIFWGLIGLVVLFGVWGILRFMLETLALGRSV
jgi:hypothetical protein